MEEDRITGERAYRIASRYGMHNKKEQEQIDDVIGFNNSTRITMCEWCGGLGPKLRPCGACQLVKYCDQKCQLADWGEHQKVCSHK